MHTAITSPDLPRLRQRAAARLGARRSGEGEPMNASEAMAVLYQLASSSDTAPDALALLHELQVYQVELDLQHEELLASLDELESSSVRLSYLFDHAPVGYLVIDAATVVREINQTALRLLGVARQDLQGRPLTGFLNGASRERTQMMLAGVVEGMAPQTEVLQFVPEPGVLRELHATADRDTTQTGFLVALMAPAAAASRAGGS